MYVYATTQFATFDIMYVVMQLVSKYRVSLNRGQPRLDASGGHVTKRPEGETDRFTTYFPANKESCRVKVLTHHKH